MGDVEMTAGYPDSHFQEVADLVGDMRKGYSRRVAEEFGVPLSTANSWISKARKKGFLPRYEDLPCRTCGGSGKRPRRDPVAARRALGDRRRATLTERRK